MRVVRGSKTLAGTASYSDCPAICTFRHPRQSSNPVARTQSSKRLRQQHLEGASRCFASWRGKVSDVMIVEGILDTEAQFCPIQPVLSGFHMVPRLSTAVSLRSAVSASNRYAAYTVSNSGREGLQSSCRPSTEPGVPSCCARNPS